MGYTCFLNSLLQALAACPTFLKYLNERSSKTDSTSFTSNLTLVLDRINGFAEDLYGDVAPVEVITSLGPLWNFDPGYQDAHDLFHVMLLALHNEAQTPTRVSTFKMFENTRSQVWAPPSCLGISISPQDGGAKNCAPPRIFKHSLK